MRGAAPRASRQPRPLPTPAPWRPPRRRCGGRTPPPPALCTGVWQAARRRCQAAACSRLLVTCPCCAPHARPRWSSGRQAATPSTNGAGGAGLWAARQLASPTWPGLPPPRLGPTAGPCRSRRAAGLLQAPGGHGLRPAGGAGGAGAPPAGAAQWGHRQPDHGGHARPGPRISAARVGHACRRGDAVLTGGARGELADATAGCCCRCCHCCLCCCCLCCCRRCCGYRRSINQSCPPPSKLARALQGFAGPQGWQHASDLLGSAALSPRLAAALVDSGMLEQVLRDSLRPDLPPDRDEVGGSAGALTAARRRTPRRAADGWHAPPLPAHCCQHARSIPDAAGSAPLIRRDGAAVGAAGRAGVGDAASWR